MASNVFCVWFFFLFLYDSFEENKKQSSQLASPSSSPIYKRVEDIDSIPITNRIEKPSPVSVLKPLFTKDDISSARIKSKSGRLYIEPLNYNVN